MNIVRVETKKHHPRRTEAACCVIIHSTGSNDFEKSDAYYRTSESGVAPHYLISRDGAVVQYVELERIAYHVGLSERDTAAYEAGLDVWTRRKGDSVIGVPYEGYAEWQARWPGKASPLELPSGAHPNGRSVGIEMLSEAGACTDEQYVALLELLGLISAQLQLVLTRDNLYGHFDANPITRVNSRGGTDPGPYFQWDRVYSALAI